MQKSKFIAMLLAVAMVISMVVVPVFANGEPYTITLTANSIAAAPGGTISLTLSTAGTIPNPGVTAVGAVIKYPAGWTLTGVDDSAATALFSGINLVPSHNDDGAGTYTMYWGMDAFTTAVGDLATLTFTIPADAALADYPFTVKNGEELNVTGTLDGEGKLIVGSLTDVEVAFAGCSVTVGSACPLHADAEYTAVDAALAETWAAGGDVLGTGTHYRLETDIALNLRLQVKGEVCIDLNGHDITLAAGKSGRIFYIFAGASLSITDSVGTGKIYGAVQATTGANNIGGTIYSEGTFNMYGGTLSGGTVSADTTGKYARGGNIYGSATSAINIYGGRIENGKVSLTQHSSGATLHSAGGNIYALGSLYIENATISGGTVELNYAGKPTATIVSTIAGGNIYAGKGVTMSNATIENGSVIRSQIQEGNYISNTRSLGGNLYTIGDTVIKDGSRIIGGTCDVVTSAGNNGVQMWIKGGNIYADATANGTVTTGNTINVTIEKSEISGGTISYDAATTTTNSAKYINDLANVQSTTLLALQGGNFYSNGANITVTGDSTISGGTIARKENVTTVVAYGQGGNAYIEKSTLDMSSGTIEGGSVDYRGGNLVAAGTSTTSSTINLSGTAKIGWGVASGWSLTAGLWDATNYNTFNISGDVQVTSASLIPAHTTLNMYGGMANNIEVRASSIFNMYGGRVKTLSGNGGATINNGYVNEITATGTITSPDCAHVNTVGTTGTRVWHNEGICSVCGHNYVADGDETACETCGVVHEAWHGAHTFDGDGNCTVNGCTKTLVAHDDSCNCGETATWTPWDGNDISGGHYYLTDNMDSFSATITDACLDLNGYTLKVEGAFDASIGGNVIDTAGTGKLADSGPAFNPSNSMLPIHVGDGYVFETPVFVQSLTHTGGDATGKFGFYLNNLAADTKMDEALKEGKITIQVNVTWDGGQKTCALSSEMPALATYADNWDTKMLLLTLTGLTDITGLTCTAQIYANGVTVQ